MSLSILLRAAAIVIAFIWAIFLVRGWIAYSEMLSYKGLFYNKAIDEAQNSLVIQSIVVAILFCGGIFSGSSNTEEVKEVESGNDSNKSIQTTKEEFIGDADLTNDAYKLFLVRKYAIEKNEALSKFVLNEKLFDSIDDALRSAADSEISAKLIKEAEAKAYQEEVEAEKQKKIDYLNSPEFKRKKLFKQLGNVFLLGGVIVMILIGLNGNKSQPQQASVAQSQKSTPNFKPTDKSYGDYRKDVLNSGWIPYIRSNEFKNWKKDYPELQFCSEDICQAHFINTKDKSKVRIIYYETCSSDRYIQCPGKPDGFENVYRDNVVEKDKSDQDFLKLKNNYED